MKNQNLYMFDLIHKLNIRIILNFIRCIPHIILFYFHQNKKIIQAETKKWLGILEVNFSQPYGLIYLLTFYPEFRNLFYHRVGHHKYWLDLICPGRSSLIIATKDIGEGLFIQHGFATAIGAKSIGKNCWINQQVTIGYDNENNRPVILDNVKIKAGAVIIGKVVIGNNVVIGANTTVLNDVPDNCSVLPQSSRIMKWSDNESSGSIKNEIE